MSRAFYRDVYDELFSNQPLLKRMKALTHRSLEKSYRSGIYSKVLEIGAGKGEHFDFVLHKFDSYIMLDPIEIPREILSKDSRISIKNSTIENSGLSKKSFDRIIMTCVLHHVEHPLDTLVSVRDLLKPNGVFSLFLPCDPGFMNRLNRRLIVNPIAKRLGVENYPLINAVEHRNHIWALLEILSEVFKNDSQKLEYYPFKFRSVNLNTFMIIHVRKTENA